MESLEKSVSAWLLRHGYPLEMRVAEALRMSGISPAHHRVYEDPITGKTREIDVVGYIDHSRMSVHLIFECKHSQDKPWVILSTPQHPITEAGYVQAVPATAPAAVVLRKHCESAEIQNLCLFRRPPIIGFRLVRAHTDNQEAAFQAIQGVTVASRATAKRIGKSGHTVIFVPIVVVDTPLLESRFTEDGKDLSVRQVDIGVVLSNSGEGELTTIKIVQSSALPEFLAAVKADVAKLISLL